MKEDKSVSVLLWDVVMDLQVKIENSRPKFERRSRQSVSMMIDNASEDVDKMFTEIMVDKLHTNPDKFDNGVINTHPEYVEAFSEVKHKLREMKKKYLKENACPFCGTMRDQVVNYQSTKLKE